MVVGVSYHDKTMATANIDERNFVRQSIRVIFDSIICTYRDSLLSEYLVGHNSEYERTKGIKKHIKRSLVFPIKRNQIFLVYTIDQLIIN